MPSEHESKVIECLFFEYNDVVHYIPNIVRNYHWRKRLENSSEYKVYRYRGYTVYYQLGTWNNGEIVDTYIKGMIDARIQIGSFGHNRLHFDN